MRSSPLALAVLGLLMAGPMHPYGMQRLLRQWGKDQVINVGQRANLYKTIRRLHEAGLIAVRQTERDQLYPERTVYELTDAGGQAAGAWLDAIGYGAVDAGPLADSWRQEPGTPVYGHPYGPFDDEHGHPASAEVIKSALAAATR